MKINRSRHRQTLLGAFRPGRTQSRTELSRSTGLSAATVSRLTRDLVRRAVLLEVPRPSRAPGRPSRDLRLNGDSACVIGISLLYPSFRALAVDLEGRVLSRAASPWPASPTRDGILEALKLVVRGAVKSARKHPSLAGIGVALPGQWDPPRGVSTLFPRVGDWKDVPLRGLVEEWSGVPATLIGYAPAHALAEQAGRAGAEPRDLVTVEVAENIAMGALVNGSLLEGASGNAGELGHLCMDPRGPACYCGNRGCLEALASCTAVCEALRGTPFAEIITRARNGDRAATEALASAGRILGRGIAAALGLFNPEILVLNGRFFDAGDLVEAPLRESLRSSALPSTLGRLLIQRSSLGADAPALGAGLASVREAVRHL
jgi:predicted NBD/HSP70 family sugar kinase